MYYKVKIHPYVFYVKVYDDDDRNILQLGSSSLRDCVSIHIFDGDNYGDLEGLLYDQLCASNIPLKKDDQGTLKMVRAIIHVAKALYPTTYEYQLTDTSSIECKPIHKHVRLADMYFFVHGQTWYEAKFGAKAKFPDYDIIKLRFQQRPSMAFEKIWKYMPKEMDYEKDRIAGLYASSNTWHEFFHAWYDTDKCLPFFYLCSSESTIMQTIAKRKTLYGTDWVIDMRDVPTDDVSVTKIRASAMPKIEWAPPKPRNIDIRLFGGKPMLVGLDD